MDGECSAATSAACGHVGRSRALPVPRKAPASRITNPLICIEKGKRYSAPPWVNDATKHQAPLPVLRERGLG